MFENEFEREFREDSYQKKRAGRGVFFRARYKQRSRGVVTPLDLMSRKERREYIKPGPVIIYNIYNTNIINIRISNSRKNEKREWLVVTKRGDLVYRFCTEAELIREFGPDVSVLIPE